ncbi:DnaJ-domain-containing protein [Annulohypoxylon truncatum]|uniref:DnaJ-domain-containing protein n=1 Tax=Annulohypoxylon truncatum TaxID=327061 RepID=UPI002007C09B|nr:DnaJ-domain-containing protein [Annulohypoxylon truncatum]KAI1209182.1 DnaJ-domain-containing protein [Annulohypoxylon truncatum]
MPSQPQGNLYSALELERTATTEQITASYRRLARIHHPDKNPGNEEAATKAFQRIQLAYSVLSNSESRSDYDNRYPSIWPSTSEDNGPHDFCDFLNEIFGFTRTNRQPDFDQLQRQFREEQEEILREWRDSQKAAYERDLAERREQRRQRAEAEEALKKAQEAAKQAKLDSEQKARDEMRAAEQSKQEERWKKLGATTKDERVQTCVHSEHCAKIPHRQKFKCDSCKVKRGITAFECPYCGLLLCQQCVVTFTKRRAMPEQALPIRTFDPQPAKEPELPDAKVEEGNGHDKKQHNAKQQGGRGHPRNPNGPPRCYKCHKLGHLAKVCRNRAGGPSGYTLGDKKHWKGNQGKPHGGDKGNGQGKVQ